MSRKEQLAKRAASQRAYYRKNQKKVLAYVKQYSEDHREEIRKKRQTHYQKNKKRIKERTARRIQTWADKLLRSARSRRRSYAHKGKEIQVTIDVEWVRRQLEKQKGCCYWSGLPLDLSYRSFLRKPSLDRLVASKGYTPGNVVITTWALNAARSTATPQQFRSFLKALKASL